MKSLSEQVEQIIELVYQDIEINYPTEVFDPAFEHYFSLLKPSLARYQHHLNKNNFDVDKLKMRYKFETAFLYTLTVFIEKDIEKLPHKHLFSWPIYQLDYPFNWYNLSENTRLAINQVDLNPHNLSEELSQVFARLISDVLNHTGKRYVGEYYTPAPLAKHIVDLSGFHPEQLLKGATVIDPACGGGVILIEIAQRVIKHSIHSNLDPLDTILSLSNHLFGYDIQAFAVVLTRTLLLYTCLPLLKEISNVKIELLFNNIKIFDPLPRLAGSECQESKFDFIIGNPPYLSVKSEFLDFADLYKHVLHGHPNLFQLFLCWAVQAAKAHGSISFLLPQSIVIAPYYKLLRKYLNEQTKIRSITRMLERKGIIGDADQQMMAMCFLRNNGNGGVFEDINIRVTNNGNDTFSTVSQKISYSRVVQHIGNSVIWVVSDNFHDYEMTEKLEQFTSKLGELPQIFRCGNGEFVWNEQKDLLRSEQEPECVPLVSAVSIEAYTHKFPFLGSRGASERQYSIVNNQTREILHTRPAVLIQRTTPRKVGRRLVACTLNKEFCTKYECYYLENHVLYVESYEKSIDDKLLYGLMGWLNSDLINFIFQMRNGTAHTSVTELVALPANKEILLEISTLAERITTVCHSMQKSSLIVELNNQIFDWLGLESKYRQRIEQVLQRTERKHLVTI